MRWKLFDARRSFPEFSGRWRRLAARLVAGHPLLDARFVAPLLAHFGDDDTRLAVLGDPDSPRAMMLIERHRPGMWRSFLPSQAQIAPVLIAASDTPRVFDLVSELPGLVLSLDLLAQDSRYAPFVEAARDEDLVEVQAHARTVSVRTTGGFDQYWESRSRALAKNIRRYGHRVERDGLELRLDVAVRVDEVLARLQDYGRLESAGWKGEAGTAISPENVQGSFYSAVMRAFADAGEARVYSLLDAGRVVSSRLVLSSTGMFVILKTTHDETYRQYAPGRLLLHAVLRDLFESAAGRTVEFYTNATGEQMSWATDDREICNLRFFRSRAARWAIESGHATRSAVRRLGGRGGPD
ncbi:MAG: GNAT family N-acetyltransferase [Burkholderiaceae bacterium]|nr:GNAT family N-acetyltransferase [Burkholderiaceae bacterium]